MKPVSGKRLCRVLERKGWGKVKGKSGHQKYRSPDGRRLIVVPVHGNKDLGPGLQADLMQ